MANDSWITPPEIYAAFNERFQFGVDLAADISNAKCPVFLSLETDNALFYQHWADFMAEQNADWGWLNPPYSNPRPFVEAAVKTQAAGKGVVMLLNDDPSVYWFRIALEACSEIWHFISNDEQPRTQGYRNGRIAFIDGDTGRPAVQNNKPQCAFVFDPHRNGDQQTRYIELADFERQGLRLIKPLNTLIAA